MLILIKIDVKSAFKSVWVINPLDGSEDYLVSDKIFGPVGESITSFRTEIISKPPPKIIKELINPFMHNVVKWPNILTPNVLTSQVCLAILQHYA